MSANLERAQLLFEQSRYPQAAEELQQVVAADPENAYAHALLALTLSEMGKPKFALASANQTIALAPDWDYSYYVMSIILFEQDKIREAKSAIRKAIEIEPEDERYFALLSNIHYQEKDWQLALEAAEEGLRINSENVPCANLRAMALTQLGRKEEAGMAIESALHKDPENALTHANQGWTLLQQGDHNTAMNHFKEALRLDPTMDWAREGIVEALKARNPIYRVFLKYLFAMSRLKEGMQWAVIIGAYVLYRVLLSVVESNPSLEPLFWPIVGLYLGFVLLTWVADPLFNLSLRLNAFGRLALSETQITASNWIGGFLLAALLMFLTGFATGNSTYYLIGAGCATMILPVSGIFKVHKPGSRRFLIGYNVVLCIVGGLAAYLALTGARQGVGLGGFFILGVVGYTWIANFFIGRD